MVLCSRPAVSLFFLFAAKGAPSRDLGKATTGTGFARTSSLIRLVHSDLTADPSFQALRGHDAFSEHWLWRVVELSEKLQCKAALVFLLVN